MAIDLKLTDDGDLILGPNGDLMIVTGDEQIAQEAVFRLKTTPGDWTLSPQIGAGLERFIGQPNTRLTRAAIEQSVDTALSFDFFIPSPDVHCVAISDNEVLITVEFNSVEDNNKMVQVVSTLDLRKGEVYSRVGFIEG